MKNKTTIGMNRTGIATSPRMAPQMVRGSERYAPAPMMGGRSIESLRASYAAEATPFGTLPPPASLREAGAQMLEAMKGNKAAVLVDKLGERAAFERTGVRLYEALFPRLDAGPTWNGGPTREEIESIHADELAHFHLVRDAIEMLGGDPTVMTPSADVSAVASLGIVQVLGDPRISLRHALAGILVAELVDGESWRMLVELAKHLGQDALAERFQEAEETEERHLVHVRRWVRAANLGEASMDLDEITEEQGVSVH